MRLEIKGLAEARQRLAVHAEEVMARALAAQAERLAQAVRDGLSGAPGSGAHDRPWARTGALRDSVGAQADGLHAAVGSSDPAAAPQEMGTATIPPRPFLAPAAAQHGEEIARAVGDAVAAALRGDQGPADAAASASASDGGTGPVSVRAASVAATGPSGANHDRPSIQLVGDWTRDANNTTAKALGMSRLQLREAIHKLKDAAGLSGDDELLFHLPTGDIYLGGEIIGNIHDE